MNAPVAHLCGFAASRDRLEAILALDNHLTRAFRIGGIFVRKRHARRVQSPVQAAEPCC